jgi:hypothetical protein
MEETTLVGTRRTRLSPSFGSGLGPGRPPLKCFVEIEKIDADQDLRFGPGRHLVITLKNWRHRPRERTHKKV